MFNIGDRIAHPMHGAGIIADIEKKKINGITREYYVLKLPVGGMIVLIPTENCEEIGVRPIIDEQQADSIINSICDIEIDMSQNWNRRYRENMLRIKSGDLIEVSRVVKGLMARDCERGLSTGERKMLRSAKQILISEMVLSKHSSYEEIEELINSVMVPKDLET